MHFKVYLNSCKLKTLSSFTNSEIHSNNRDNNKFPLQDTHQIDIWNGKWKTTAAASGTTTTTDALVVVFLAFKFKCKEIFRIFTKFQTRKRQAKGNYREFIHLSLSFPTFLICSVVFRKFCIWCTLYNGVYGNRFKSFVNGFTCLLLVCKKEKWMHARNKKWFGFSGGVFVDFRTIQYIYLLHVNTTILENSKKSVAVAAVVASFAWKV